MSFTAQTKEGPKQKIHMNLTEVMRLLEFAKASQARFVTLTASETGIGQYIEVSDSTGQTRDITDYASW
jgi:hypothetical protein